MPVKVGLKVIQAWNNDNMEKQICAFEAENAPKGQIVFYGPSNFTRWRREKWGNTPLREALLGASGAQCCVNRGFGSSCPEHHLYYYSRAIRPLEPKVLVYSPGMGNGLSFGYTVDELYELAVRVVTYALTDFPGLRVYILGLPKRSLDTEAGRKMNGLLCGFCEMNPRCTFLRVAAYEPLNDPGILMPDGVHFNNEGYLRYTDYFKKALKDELAQF
ncbi:MAG: hypothetical protein Q3977_01345 [Oscillospiraceae bacterium]|nr:hypothetical protein [Oscillospiraceae bacterium]